MKKGFSLVEVMIALGVLAVASVGVMKISTNTAKVQKRAETFQNVLSIEQRINLAVLNPDSCANSLGSNGANISLNKDIQIRNPNNDLIYEANPNNSIMNNTISINHIRIVDLDLTGATFTNPSPPNNTLRTGQAFIEVNYSKSSNTLDVKEQEYTKKVGPINLVVDEASRNLVECRSPVNQAVEAAIGRICQQLGGVYNANTLMCESNNAALDANPSPQPANPADRLAPGLLDNRYVSRQGDNVVGPLPLTVSSAGGLITEAGAPLVANGSVTANGNVVANGTLLANQGLNMPAGRTICIGSQCLDFNATCPNNMYQEGFEPNGSPRCKILPSSECGPGQYIVSVNNGVVECGVIPEAAQGVCPENTVLMGYRADGTKDCRDTGSVVGKNCEDDETLNGFDINGDPICTSDSLSGLTFKSMYLTEEGGLTFTPPAAYDRDFEIDGKRCSRTNRRCENDSRTTCSPGFKVTNLKRESRRSGGISNKNCWCDWSCVPDQEKPIEIAFRECSPEQGRWSVTSSGSCQCPGYDPFRATAPAQGTENISSRCVGDKCGAGCDPATKPETQRTCYCYPCSRDPNGINGVNCGGGFQP